MAERVYSVLLHVPESQLTTVLDVVRVPTVLVSVTPTEESRNSPMPHVSRFRNGKRNKGITGVQLAEKYATETKRVFAGTELRDVFVQHGFAENSYSPCLNRLVKAGKIRNLGDGRYCSSGVTMRL